MSETVFKNIGSFMQDSCLSTCKYHPEEQISYINISPYDVETRFMCIECYQSSSYTKEEKNYLISLRKFILKQEQEPHYQILNEDTRLQVQKTLETKGKVNLREKIQQFCCNLVDQIQQQLNEVQKEAESKTQLIQEKLEALQLIFNEITNPQSIFDIFDTNRHNLEELNSKLDHYLKLSYIRVNQLQEGNTEYEDLFNQFTLDQAETVLNKVLDRIKAITFYIPSIDSDKSKEHDKSIFQDNPITIDDSSISLKNQAFIKLIQQIPNINPSLLAQIEKKLIGIQIFEDVDFDNEEEYEDDEISVDNKKNNIQQQNVQQGEENVERAEDKQNELIGEQQLIGDGNNQQNKEMKINDAISPITIKSNEKKKRKTKPIQANKEDNENMTEQELSEFISNALNDEIPFTQIQRNSKNHSRYASDYPMAQNNKNKLQFQSQIQQQPYQQQQMIGQNQYSSQSLMQSSDFPQNTVNNDKSYQQFQNPQLNAHNIRSSCPIQYNRFNELSQSVQNSNKISDQTDISSFQNQTNRDDLKMSKFPLQFYSQNMEQNNTNIQQSYMGDSKQIGHYNQEDISAVHSHINQQQQQQSLLHLQKYQSSNYDNYFMEQRRNEVVQQNENQQMKSLSRDSSPVVQQPNSISSSSSSRTNDRPVQQKIANDYQQEIKAPIKEEEDEHKQSIASGSGFIMREFEDYQASKVDNEHKLSGLIQMEGQLKIMKLKKSGLGSTDSIKITHQKSGIVTIDNPSDYYSHYIISKEILDANKSYAFLFSIRCSKNDSVIIGITPKEYVNVNVLHKMPYYKSFVNTTYETFSESCERIEKGKSIRCSDECIHVVLKVSISNDIFQVHDYPNMMNINSIKNPAHLKSIKQFYLTIGLTKSKESFNNPPPNPLRVQLLETREIDPSQSNNKIQEETISSNNINSNSNNVNGNNNSKPEFDTNQNKQ